MIRSANIKQILGKIPKGTTMSISEIQDFVRANWPLTREDWAIHTDTRPTNYRKWLHRIQGVLSELKKKGIVVHHPDTCSYTF